MRGLERLFLLANASLFASIGFVTALSLTMSAAPRVAVVTGASRGIGRGIALELGTAGYAVYCIGRSSRTGRAYDDQRDVAEGLDLTVESAAGEVSRRGGRGTPCPCDLSSDDDIERVLDEVYEKEGRLDVLVCSAFTTPAKQSIRGEFWTQGMQVR